MRKFNILAAILLLFFYYCDNTHKNSNNQNDTIQNNIQTSQQINLQLKISPEPTDKLIIGQSFEIIIDGPDIGLVDSLVLFVNDKYLTSMSKAPFRFEWSSTNSKVGKKNFSITAYHNGNRTMLSKTRTLLSDIKPVLHKYKVINVFPHDKLAYTQGLFFFEGLLYEATGLQGESSLRKTKLETGDIIQSYNVPADIFGEGIALVDNRIIQLSWQNRIGYVYDLKTFNVIDKFSYPTEGWGITFDGTNLIMSDGSSTLYVLDPQSYTQISTIEVYDNNGPMSKLNELEYIEGKIFANIYLTENIAIIDPVLGKVTGMIDLTGILSERDKDKETDVLNGIAYDFDKKRIFVTGKRYPKLFEIKIL